MQEKENIYNVAKDEQKSSKKASPVVTYDSFEEIEDIVTAKGSGTIGCCL